MNEFTIVRDKWARFGKNGSAQLLNEKGCKCCLGFYATACGLRDDQLEGVGTPSDTLPRATIPDWLLDTASWGNSDAAIELMHANDRVSLDDSGKVHAETEEELEAFIIAKFAEHGVTVRFVDTEADA